MKQQIYNSYRQTYPCFVYDSYHYDVQPDGLHIAFSFLVGENIAFHPTAFIPSRRFLPMLHHTHPFASKQSDPLVDLLVFNIGMIELISYWKAFCPPKVVVKPFALTQTQVDFWKKLYFNGLGEFFYTNGISASFDDFLTFEFPCSDSRNDGMTDERIDGMADLLQQDSRPLHIVPIGGGKDSVVTLESLRNSYHVVPLIMNPRGATLQCVERAGYTVDDVLVIKRDIDPLLLELNKHGALNGHTPFSAMLAFYTLLAATLTQRNCNIALSNENSANESTVANTNVNHQYSKSVEFEDDFRHYVDDFWRDGVSGCSRFNYYSFLRPLSELQIAMLFATHHQYFDVFKSCNVGSKEDIWCGHCAKCLFAYIILSPFIEPERLYRIFGKNMLDDASLKTVFDQLRGAAETKPFECVGTVDEVNSALSMTLARWYPDTVTTTQRVESGKLQHTPALIADYRPMPLSVDTDKLSLRHNLPGEEFLLLEQEVRSNTIAGFTHLFNIFAFKRILIAGFGREGQSTLALLRLLFPRGGNWDIAHNDKEIIDCLKTKEYDLVMKSPGIPSSLFNGLCPKHIITSQTDIFLQVFHQHTIGITGTKGKSTTATLLWHQLNTFMKGRVDVILAGNIGIPLFDIIPKITDRTIVVAELSCHQLENIHVAPHISLLLNIYPEHLDHYDSYLDYQMAKFQIALRQNLNDIFVYCKDNAELDNLVQQYKPQLCDWIIPYGIDDVNRSGMLNDENIPLKGDHNKLNIYAVSLVTQVHGMPSEDFMDSLLSFKGLEHRLEYVDTVDGVIYYNDSISTIPQTAIAALEALKTVDTLILGGFSRGIDYSPLVHYLENEPLGMNVHNLVLFGKAGEEIFSLMDKNNGKNLLCRFSADYDMAEAVRFAAEHTSKGKICLLSPAASSYDHYKNFEHRGKDFKECVKDLVNSE